MRFNLICKRGHRHFTPAVYLDYFNGRECGASGGGGVCREKMSRLEPKGTTTKGRKR